MSNKKKDNKSAIDRINKIQEADAANDKQLQELEDALIAEQSELEFQATDDLKDLEDDDNEITFEPIGEMKELLEKDEKESEAKVEKLKEQIEEKKTEIKESKENPSEPSKEEKADSDASKKAEEKSDASKEQAEGDKATVKAGADIDATVKTDPSPEESAKKQQTEPKDPKGTDVEEVQTSTTPASNAEKDLRKTDAAGQVLAEETDLKTIKENTEKANEKSKDTALTPPRTPEELGEGLHSESQDIDKPETPKDNFKGQLTVLGGKTAVQDLSSTPQEPNLDRILGQSVERAEPTELENSVVGKDLQAPFSPELSTGRTVLGLNESQVRDVNERELQALKEFQDRELADAEKSGINTDVLKESHKQALETQDAAAKNRIAELTEKYPPVVEQQNVSKEDLDNVSSKAKDVIAPFESVVAEAGNQERVSAADIAELKPKSPELKETEDKEDAAKKTPNETGEGDKTAKINEGEVGVVNSSALKLNDAVTFNNTAEAALTSRQDALKKRIEAGEEVPESEQRQLELEREQFEVAAAKRIEDAKKGDDDDNRLLNGSMRDITGKPLMKDVIDAMKSGTVVGMIGTGFLPPAVVDLATPEAVPSKETEETKQQQESPEQTRQFESIGSVEGTTIEVSDLADGASYEYQLLDSTGRGVNERIRFQKGDPRQSQTGFTAVDLINILIDQLTSSQQGDLANDFTMEALNSLERARASLADRKRDREERGVLYSKEK